MVSRVGEVELLLNVRFCRKKEERRWSGGHWSAGQVVSRDGKDQVTIDQRIGVDEK